MNLVALLTDKELEELFTSTAIQIGIRPEAIEKDFWVCYALDHLFNGCKFKDSFVFKGGTSLSKSYHLINRFSEDIDLILDWRKIISDDSDPWAERSKSKQDQYNKQLNSEAAKFYRKNLVPVLNDEMGDKLKVANLFSVDDQDEMVVNFSYPKLFNDNYLRPIIRLEIGPLAEWTPSHLTTITPFVAEKYPDIFNKVSTDVLTVDAERTFWEKITILHKIAHFPEDKMIPKRYARHLYDVYCMGHSSLKQSAFACKELLRKDVIFKQKFYYSKGSHYETATLNDINLIPREDLLSELQKDYKAMENMIYGDVPSFEEIIKYLIELQNEIHSLR
ncbi:MAG: nucleotidyl transferase AbiEii/AbiGii toxin family protein [Clostridiales bacterium]|nr:nucleotidyl transferase AbiEii/AbiGii toxin family protein [Clostridiales bacterium]